ncbi:hypothetical protein N752_10430 [Desulforamulus aquiferis]|nr:flagellar hook-length control protein FliK [Desulforamulus aquiferis]RYD05202.1 hypothetical protein N752_10430 [Desulforamulus aquiferis]
MIDRVMSALLRTTGTMKVTPTKPLDKVQQNPFILQQKNPGEAATEALKVTKGPTAAAPEATIADRQEQLNFVPLPLRSPLYEDTRFYWKLKDFKAKISEDGESKIIFSVNTYTLGLLWFTMTSQPGKLLSLQCITEDNSVAEVFRSSSEILRQELQDAGFSNVVVSYRVQAGIRGIADLDPDFATPGTTNLIDLQV